MCEIRYSQTNTYTDIKKYLRASTLIRARAITDIYACKQHTQNAVKFVLILICICI